MIFAVVFKLQSALSNKPKQATSEAVALGQDDKAENLRSYYAQSPIGTVGTVVNSDPGVYAAPTPTRTMQTRNPFVDANGKRKKHFEFYQYFRVSLSLMMFVLLFAFIKMLSLILKHIFCFYSRT